MHTSRTHYWSFFPNICNWWEKEKWSSRGYNQFNYTNCWRMYERNPFRKQIQTKYYFEVNAYLGPAMSRVSRVDLHTKRLKQIRQTEAKGFFSGTRSTARKINFHYWRIFKWTERQNLRKTLQWRKKCHSKVSTRSMSMARSFKEVIPCDGLKKFTDFFISYFYSCLERF